MQPLLLDADHSREAALIEFGRALREHGYRFVTPTPETHRRVVAQRAHGRDLRDLLGWSLPCAFDVLPPSLRAAAERAGILDHVDAGRRSRLRFSSIGELLVAHSACPTTTEDSVFFGPDTHRFARMLEQAATGRWRRVVDVGCGTGAGGLLLAGRADEVVLADINPSALALARVNAAINGIENIVVRRSDVLAGVDGGMDLVVANPPYLADELGRLYRDGGGDLGTGLALRIVEEALARLEPGGILALYTGTPIIGGVDLFWRAVRPLLAGVEGEIDYRELDPDVFGEELDRPAYRGCERIAVVALIVRRPVQR